MFSLPSESTTPHTSNLSMTSTITTKLSPTLRRSTLLHMQEQVSSIRRTTEIVGTILQQMTLACNQICVEHNVIRATEDLKRLYLQLMTLPRDDLTCFVQAFSLDEGRVNDDIVRQVSNDENEGPPSRPSTYAPHFAHRYNEKQHYSTCRPPAHNVTLMCSPNSDDMRTATVVEDDDDGDDEEYDDLRRTVGSNDYDGGDMEREAPEEGCKHLRQARVSRCYY